VQVIPAVDVLDGAVVRLRRGDYEDVTTYGGDPVAMVAGFAAEGAPLVHVVDLAAARTGERSPGLWERLGGAGLPVQGAGGIRDVADAERVVEFGVKRVVTGTAAVWSPGTVRDMVEAIGADRVVVALDVKDGRARGAGWEDDGRGADAVAADAVAAGAGRVMVTAVAKDGMLEGPDLGLLGSITGSVPIPVIASGGVGSLADLAVLAALPVEGAVVGKAFYEGLFTYPEAVAAAAR
jgi:phosphoribosylformimino-5-aminoimidazole carboxamide ribotide isomerase